MIINKDCSYSISCSNRLKQFFSRKLFGYKWSHIAITKRKIDEKVNTFKNGQSWIINGTSDLLRICKEDYNIGNEDFTIDFWIKINQIDIRDWSYIAKRNLMNYIY